MPASNIGSYSQEARNNIDAMRPALICTDANQPMGQCQNMHVSTNCYYGYHNLKSLHTHQVDTDCEMVELEIFPEKRPSNTITRKRSAEEDEHPQKKRLREGPNLTTEPEHSSARPLLFGGRLKMILPYAALLAHGQVQATQLPPLM